MSLPNGYKRVAYIESAGTQYIDTGYKANNNTRVVIDIQMTDTSVNNQWLYGARDAAKTNSFGFYWYNSAFGANFGTGQNAIPVPSAATERLFIDHNKNAISFNGAYSTFTSATFSGSYNLTIFAVNTTGTTNNNVRAKLFSCQIYDNGTIKRDFIPCKNASGVVGLYDTVNNVFYTDAAGGTFTAGAELIPSHKIVDGTMLDTALSATADAIRARTGENGEIVWNEQSGFAAVASAISGGSKIAMGSVKSAVTTQTITVSGLTFKPKHIIVHLAVQDYDNQCGARIATSLEYGERTTCTYYKGTSNYFEYGNCGSVTFNSDGFKITLPSTSSGGYFYPANYNYIAIG